MIKFDSYLLASYYALIILSDVDNEIHELELEVITRFVKENNSSSYFDKEEEFQRILGYSHEDRILIYNECIKYIAVNANSSFKEKFYSFIGELVSADGVVRNSELELCIFAREIFGYTDNIFFNNTSKEIDQDVNKALKNSYLSNKSITYSSESMVSIELKFETLNGLLIHKITYDNSKINYDTASDKLKAHMDNIRHLSREICFEMIKTGVLGNRKSFLNFRFTFNNDNVNYFVIADLYPNKVFLSYVGNNEWDYHIK